MRYREIAQVGKRDSVDALQDGIDDVFYWRRTSGEKEHVKCWNTAAFCKQYEPVPDPEPAQVVFSAAANEAIALVRAACDWVDRNEVTRARRRASEAEKALERMKSLGVAGDVIDWRRPEEEMPPTFYGGSRRIRIRMKAGVERFGRFLDDTPPEWVLETEAAQRLAVPTDMVLEWAPIPEPPKGPEKSREHAPCPFPSCGSTITGIVELTPPPPSGDMYCVSCRMCGARGPTQATEDSAWQAWDSRDD